MIALTVIIATIIAPVAVLTAFFTTELLLGLKPLKISPSTSAAPSTIIVTPAHNEALLIGQTVAALSRVGRGEVPVLVVADNCSDDTADRARAAGADVLVRDDASNRGKGFALAAARDWLGKHPPEVVVVIDADCRLDERSLAALVNQAKLSGRPCQAIYLLDPDLGASPLVQISNFAFMIKNMVRQRALQRVAGRVHLTGTGMAFPWAVYSEAEFGGADIVEDLAMGLHLSSRALPPMLVEDATVWSGAATAEGTLVQRRRWEGGYLFTALRSVPDAVVRSLRRADLGSLCAVIDLCLPPLALLTMLNAGALMLGLTGKAIGASAWPLLVQLIVDFGACAALASAWFMYGRPFVQLRSLLKIPLYVLWKLPLYLAFLRRGVPTDWLRAGR